MTGIYIHLFLFLCLLFHSVLVKHECTTGSNKASKSPSQAGVLRRFDGNQPLINLSTTERQLVMEAS